MFELPEGFYCEKYVPLHSFTFSLLTFITEPNLIQRFWNLWKLMKWQIVQGPIASKLEKNTDNFVKKWLLSVFLIAKQAHITTDTYRAIRQALW